MKIYSVAVHFQASHLSAVQGSDEERNDMYTKVHRMSTTVTDAAMRQKLRRCFWLCQKAGLSDE